MNGKVQCSVFASKTFVLFLFCEMKHLDIERFKYTEKARNIFQTKALCANGYVQKHRRPIQHTQN